MPMPTSNQTPKLFSAAAFLNSAAPREYFAARSQFF
jgi:hypothetical protein